MAAIHLKFLVHPTTDEVFSRHVVEAKTNRIISQHKNLRLALDKAERINLEAAPVREIREEFSSCGYEDDRKPYACAAPATVTDIETGCTFCASHFREVILWWLTTTSQKHGKPDTRPGNRLASNPQNSSP